jgi:hypothetical protein
MHLLKDNMCQLVSVHRSTVSEPNNYEAVVNTCQNSLLVAAQPPDGLVSPNPTFARN